MPRRKKSTSEEIQAADTLDLVDKDGNNVFALEDTLKGKPSRTPASKKRATRSIVVEDDIDNDNDVEAETLETDSDVHDLTGDYSKAPLKSATNLMKLPVFLSRSFKDVRHYQIHQKTKGKDQIYGVHIIPNPTYGAPSITDALLLKFCMSAFKRDTAQSVIEKKSKNPLAAPTLRFHARRYFDFIDQQKIGGSQLKALRNALIRFQTTKIYFYTIDPTKSGSVEPEKQLHSSFVTEFMEEKIPTKRSKTKITQFTVKFGSWMKEFFLDDKAILTLNKGGYFVLDPVEMKFHEFFRVFLGTKPYFKISLRNIATRLGYLRSSDEDLKGRKLNYVRTEIYHIIADNTLLGYSAAIEPPKPNGAEIVCIYNSNWRTQISEDIDPETKTKRKHPVTNKPLTVLENELLKKEGNRGLRWFDKDLIHYSDMRKKLMNENDKGWIAHHKNDMDILRHGDIDEEKLTDKEKTRYRLLDLCRFLEKDSRSYQQKDKKTLPASTTATSS